MAKPKRKPSPKGMPPKPSQPSHVVGNAADKPEASSQVPCNFRVSPEFRRRLKAFAVAHDKNMVDVFEAAVNEYMSKRGG